MPAALPQTSLPDPASASAPAAESSGAPQDLPGSAAAPSGDPAAAAQAETSNGMMPQYNIWGGANFAGHTPYNPGQLLAMLSQLGAMQQQPQQLQPQLASVEPLQEAVQQHLAVETAEPVQAVQLQAAAGVEPEPALTAGKLGFATYQWS